MKPPILRQGAVSAWAPWLPRGRNCRPQAPSAARGIRQAARSPFQRSPPAAAQHPRVRPGPGLPRRGLNWRPGGGFSARGWGFRARGAQLAAGGSCFVGRPHFVLGGPFSCSGFPTMAMAWEVRLADGRCADTSRVYPSHRWGGPAALCRAPATSRVARQVPAFRALPWLHFILCKQTTLFCAHLVPRTVDSSQTAL